METNAKSRVIMLALSGLLFGATAFGWVVHEANKVREISDASLQASTASSDAGQPTSQLNASERPPEIAAVPAAFRGYRSTSMDDAVRAARASIRQDPTQPVLASALTSHFERARVRHQSADSQTIFVPPPPGAGLIDPPKAFPPDSPYGDEYVHQAPPQAATKLGVEDLRLVGVIEGKAIFKVRRKVADALALPYSVTLGKGETIGDLKLQSVGKEAATVQDGSKVATKSLEPVH